MSTLQNGSHVGISDFKSEEEMKTLFTDPALRDQDEDDKGKSKRTPPRRSCSTQSNKDAVTMVSVTESVKVDDPVSLTSNNVMSRRITIAGGFLDMALFTANIEQLKFVMELGHFYVYYRQTLALIITSLVLQMLVGFTLFLLGCHVIKKLQDEYYATVLNHLTMGLVALITIVNLFISAFGPKGTAIAMCLGAFSVPNTSSSLWHFMANSTEPRSFFS